MFGTKSGLRVIATSLVTLISLAGTPLVADAAAQYPATLNFLSSKFVDGKTMDGFTPGKPDYGFTLEAMLQLRAGGKKIGDQAAAVKALLADTTVFAKSAVSNFAYDTAKNIKPGLAGKFLVASAALAVPNAPLRNSLVADLKKSIASDGSISLANGNTFDYAWTTLGLAAVGQYKLANQVAVKLASLERPDGGFGTDQTGNTTASAADATGIALQAFALAKKTGSKAQVLYEQKAILTGTAYLKTTEVSGDHWESFGDVDVNGTAYAAMGLKATGANIPEISTWLKGRLASDGGLTTPWSAGHGDTFATAQAYVPLIGSSYLNLLQK
jgi:hypothetical protein